MSKIVSDHNNQVKISLNKLIDKSFVPYLVKGLVYVKVATTNFFLILRGATISS